eukprot:GHUV01033118.1.p1 GENE.GHUV01033118.1~~GHUV01033118.1.p1  ORF type:complete len:112 (-),score=8.82 GHUV01033118.1:203-538(-)
MFGLAARSQSSQVLSVWAPDTSPTNTRYAAVLSQQMLSSPSSDMPGLFLLTFVFNRAAENPDQSQIVCNGCRVLLSYPRGAQSVQCSLCRTVTQVRRVAEELDTLCTWRQL